ncbi:MAG: radical SAM protein [Firmicutes bacterium]|nr:radical SAM protein [Bacillota bacterium]
MSVAKRHILPFFIPMRGCAYTCVYCDQHSISGQALPPTPRIIEEQTLAYKGPFPAQAAFYGGSFTALPWHEQEAYLNAVQPAQNEGFIDSIRVSTRPDAIDSANLERLSRYKVTTLELGIQSFDAAVLKAAGRIYSPDTACKACLEVRKAGLILGIQLMSGLPQDTAAKSLSSMKQSCEIGADFFRIYPTLVLQNTPLAFMYNKGLYKPQELTEAVLLAARMLAIALQHDIPVIRLGLNPSQYLEQALIAGPYHPAFGQLVRGALTLQQALALLTKVGEEAVLLNFPATERSLLFGQKNEQWHLLQERWPALIAREAAKLPPGTLQVYFKGGASMTLTRNDFLKELNDPVNELAQLL